MRCLGVSARGAGGLLCVTPMFAFFGGASLRALSVEPCASERSRHRYVPPWRASVRVVGIWHWFVKGCPTIGTMEPEEDTERIAKLREQRRADRERVSAPLLLRGAPDSPDMRAVWKALQADDAAGARASLLADRELVS